MADDDGSANMKKSRARVFKVDFAYQDVGKSRLILLSSRHVRAAVQARCDAMVSPLAGTVLSETQSVYILRNGNTEGRERGETLLGSDGP